MLQSCNAYLGGGHRKKSGVVVKTYSNNSVPEIHMWFCFEDVSITNICTCVLYMLLSRNVYVWRIGNFCALSDKARLRPPGVFSKTCIIGPQGELAILQGKCETTSTLAHPSRWWVWQVETFLPAIMHCVNFITKALTSYHLLTWKSAQAWVQKIGSTVCNGLWRASFPSDSRACNAFMRSLAYSEDKNRQKQITVNAYLNLGVRNFPCYNSHCLVVFSC